MNSEFLRAALEPILLETISTGASYGYEIARHVQEASEGKLLTQEGTLYPALHRLEKQKLLKSKWSVSPEGRRRKHYELTSTGRKRLEAVRAEWRDFSTSVSQILGLTFGIV
jgi:transcriptional regulator